MKAAECNLTSKKITEDLWEDSSNGSITFRTGFFEMIDEGHLGVLTLGALVFWLIVCMGSKNINLTGGYAS